MVSIIVAVAENGVIGDKNTLLWHISEDLKHFKAVTTGHPVIMGRKTYESLGRPLPNRTNVVITRQQVEIPGCRVVHSLGEAVALFPGDDEVFVIGGALGADYSFSSLMAPCELPLSFRLRDLRAPAKLGIYTTARLARIPYLCTAKVFLLHPGRFRAR